MKGSMSKKLRKALCALFAGALVITSVPTANVVAYAEKTAGTPSTTKEVKKSWSLDELKVVKGFGYTAEGSGEEYTLDMPSGYGSQVFYAIPEEVDMSRFVSLELEISADTPKYCIKLCTSGYEEARTCYDKNVMLSDTAEFGSNLDIELKDVGVVCLMSTNIENDVAKPIKLNIKKITFTVQADPEEEDSKPGEDSKPEEPKEPVYERPVVDAPVVDVAEKPTTEEPTVEEPTTEQPTVEEPTTEQPTTEEPTTEEPTVEEPTTEEPTVEEPTTEEPTVEEPTEPEPEKQPVVEKVTGKAITVTAGETAKIKMPCKKSKIKSVKYSKLSAKAAKIVKIDKKNNKVKGLKAGKATIKATITKKNGDKIVMTTKVTVKAAPKPVTKPTTPQAKAYSYTMDKLNSFAAWDVTASGSGSNYKVTFSRQYAQIFYEIPSEVDVANLKSVVVEFDDSSKVAIKLGQKFVEYSDTDSVYGIVYETDTFAYGAENVTLANSKIAKKDIKWVNFMNLQDGSLTRTIKKITFKL